MTRRIRTPEELVGTPLFKAVMNVFLADNHRWMPADKAKRAKLRKLGPDGQPTAETVAFITATALAVADEFKTPDGKLVAPDDPAEAGLALAATAYLATIGGAPFADDVFGAGIGHFLQDGHAKALRHTVVRRGVSAGERDQGAHSDAVKALIAAAVDKNPDATTPAIATAITTAARVALKAAKDPDTREHWEAVLLFLQGNRDAIRQRIERHRGTRD